MVVQWCKVANYSALAALCLSVPVGLPRFTNSLPARPSVGTATGYNEGKLMLSCCGLSAAMMLSSL